MIKLSKRTFIVFCILLALATPKFCSFLSDYQLSMREHEYKRFQKYHAELNDTTIFNIYDVDKKVSMSNCTTIKNYSFKTDLYNYDKNVTDNTSETINLCSEKNFLKENEKTVVKKESEKKNDFCINVSNDEIIWMVRCVFAENMGRTYEDMLATAAAIVNRYKETPKEHRKNGIFSIVTGNQFANPNPPYEKAAIHNFNNADISKNGLYYKAVIAALKGKDPTNGSSYFYNIYEIDEKYAWHEKAYTLEYSGYISPDGNKYFHLKK
jgi:hypothetical protein